MIDASEDLREQFPAAASGENRQASQEKEETVETLRERLAQLEKQRATPEAELRYTYGGMTETRTHAQVDSDNEALIKDTQEKIALMEKEKRRQHYMERARDSGPNEEQDQEPDQT